MLSYKNIFENYKIFFNLLELETDIRQMRNMIRETVHRKYFMAHLSKYFYDTYIYIKYEIIQQNTQPNI